MTGKALQWLLRRYLSGELQPPPEALARWPQLREPAGEVIDYARENLLGKLIGREWHAACPGCGGRLIVQADRWRCLGCGGQEVLGIGVAGLMALVSGKHDSQAAADADVQRSNGPKT